MSEIEKNYKQDIYSRMADLSTGKQPITIFEFKETKAHCMVILRLNSAMKMRCYIKKSEKHYENDIATMMLAAEEWKKEKKK